MASPARFRFRPRYRALAAGAIAVGLVAAALGGLYLGSPAWKLQVLVDDDALEVRSGEDRRFRLAWPEVVRVVASPATATCFVDGGAPERSLLVPGIGAPAPYQIERRAELYAAIVAHVPAERIRQVELLERGNSSAP